MCYFNSIQLVGSIARKSQNYHNKYCEETKDNIENPILRSVRLRRVVGQSETGVNGAVRKWDWRWQLLRDRCTEEICYRMTCTKH